MVSTQVFTVKLLQSCYLKLFLIKFGKDVTKAAMVPPADPLWGAHSPFYRMRNTLDSCLQQRYGNTEVSVGQRLWQLPQWWPTLVLQLPVSLSWLGRVDSTQDPSLKCDDNMSTNQKPSPPPEVTGNKWRRWLMLAEGRLSLPVWEMGMGVHPWGPSVAPFALLRLMVKISRRL